jgi:hypothetical protein
MGWRWSFAQGPALCEEQKDLLRGHLSKMKTSRLVVSLPDLPKLKAKKKWRRLL